MNYYFCENRDSLHKLPDTILKKYGTYCVELTSETHRPVIKIGWSANIKQRVASLHTQPKGRRCREIRGIILTRKTETDLHSIFDHKRLCRKDGKVLRASFAIREHFGCFSGSTEVFDITVTELLGVLV